MLKFAILVSLAAAALSVVGAVAFTPALAADAVDEVRLYALHCGRIQVKDMGMFSDTGEYTGKAGKLADPCFVIRHPKRDAALGYRSWRQAG
jgi:N-acyl homoserine lactone hydrolase